MVHSKMSPFVGSIHLDLWFARPSDISANRLNGWMERLLLNNVHVVRGRILALQSDHGKQFCSLAYCLDLNWRATQSSLSLASLLACFRSSLSTYVHTYHFVACPLFTHFTYTAPNYTNPIID